MISWFSKRACNTRAPKRGGKDAVDTEKFAFNLSESCGTKVYTELPLAGGL